MKCNNLKIAISMILPVLSLVFAGESKSSNILILNPYQGVDWAGDVHHKANFHTHTTASDGWLNPNDAVDEYKNRDYTILAITDHHRATYPWTDFESLSPSSLSLRRYENEQISSLDYENRCPESISMVAVAGNEMVVAGKGLDWPHDCLSLFSDFELGDTSLDMALEKLAQYSDKAIAAMAHPAKEWYRHFGAKPGLEIPLSAPLRAITQDDFTIEAWFRASDNSRNVLIGNYGSQASGVLNLKIQTWLNEVRFYMQPEGEGEKLDLFLSVNDLDIDVRDRDWHHIAAVRRDDMIYIYIDGIELGSSPDKAGSYDLLGQILYIGKDTRSGPTEFKGDIDNLRLWQRGLSSQEIAALAAGELPGDRINREALLAEYLFETSNGVCVSESAGSQVDDTALHPQGPFHISSIQDGFYINNIADKLKKTSGSNYALSFTFPDPTDVPQDAVEYYIELYRDNEHLVAIEVTNEHYQHRLHQLDRKLWDSLLEYFMPNRPIWGMANDDMHSLSMLGRCWSVLPMKNPCVDSVRQAIIDGAYYFSTIAISGEEANKDLTPRINSIIHNPENGTITAQAVIDDELAGEQAYKWLSNGKLIHTGSGLHYKNNDKIGSYARLEITGSGGTTFTNPFGFIRKSDY